MKYLAQVRSYFVLTSITAGTAGLIALIFMPMFHTPMPSIIAPEVVDLGIQEKEQVVVGRFPVTNRGTGDLILTEFATSCACAAIEIELNGEQRLVDSVRIPPGESIELLARIAVGGRPGTSQKVFASFATNDLHHKRLSVALVISQVKGGICASPLAVVFGDLPIASPTKQQVRLYDNGIKGRTIQKAESSRPDRFHIKLISHGKSSMTNELGYELIGILEVEPRTSKAGPLDGQIVIHTANEDRPADSIQVIGRVVDFFEVRPDSLLLPRMAREKDIYIGHCSVIPTSDTTIKIEVETMPPGWSATVGRDNSIANALRVEVSYDSERFPPPVSFIMTLVVSSDERRVRVNLPIVLRDHEQ